MMRTSHRRRSVLIGLLGCGALIVTAAGCGDDGEPTHVSGGTGHSVIVLNEEGEDLNAYDPADGFRKQVVVSGGEDEHAGGLSLNGEICFDPHTPGRFVTADDAGQPTVSPGWVVLQLHGSRVGELSVTRVGRLRPTFQANPDPYGCAMLKDGRILTTDIGHNQSGPGDGQLIAWFLPFDAANSQYCKLDITIGTAGGIYVDEQDRIYVASARVDPAVFRYTGPFPTSADAAGGCGGRDSTGAPMADVVRKEKFIAQDGSARTPNAIVGSGHGTFYVSSILNGVIAEYDANGMFIRRVMSPLPGEGLGPTPYTNGSPLGLGVDSTGTLYFADLGLVARGLAIGPGHLLGTVRRIRFENGQPLPPEVMDSQLAFPDGIGVLEQ